MVHTSLLLLYYATKFADSILLSPSQTAFSDLLESADLGLAKKELTSKRWRTCLSQNMGKWMIIADYCLDLLVDLFSFWTCPAGSRNDFFQVVQTFSLFCKFWRFKLVFRILSQSSNIHLISPWIFWSLPECSGIFLNLRESFGISQNLLEFFRIYPIYPEAFGLKRFSVLVVQVSCKQTKLLKGSCIISELDWLRNNPLGRQGRDGRHTFSSI